MTRAPATIAIGFSRIAALAESIALSEFLPPGPQHLTPSPPPTTRHSITLLWWRFDAVMQPAARDAFRRLLAQGWMDAARQLRPAERMYTYWVNDNAFRQNKGMRLDFILLSAPLRAAVTAAAVDTEYRGREKPSDHAPTWVALRQRA
jgi:hypothetical protein